MSCHELSVEIRNLFGVVLSAEQAAHLETVGQLHDVLRANFADQLTAEPMVFARFVGLTCVRRALGRVLETDLMDVSPTQKLDELLPEKERYLLWQALNKELDGILPKLLLPSPYAQWLTFAYITSVFGIPIFLFVMWDWLKMLYPIRFDWGFWFWVSSPLGVWLVNKMVLAPMSTDLPFNCSRITHLVEAWCISIVNFEPYEQGERELWFFLRCIIADTSGFELKRITRTTKFRELGIE